MLQAFFNLWVDKVMTSNQLITITALFVVLSAGSLMFANHRAGTIDSSVDVGQLVSST